LVGRSRDCPDGFGAGRLRKAGEFLEAADIVEQDMSDAAVNLYVLDGTAASDAICCSRLGRYAIGENHHEAVALLRQADDTLERHLSTLLGVKSKVAYTHESATATERKKARRSAEALVEAARRIARGGS
jgi:hypothetical protein